MSPIMTLSITAEPMRATGRKSAADSHQIMLGEFSGIYIHITPTVAAQWLTVLTPIAQEADK